MCRFVATRLPPRTGYPVRRRDETRRRSPTARFLQGMTTWEGEGRTRPLRIVNDYNMSVAQFRVVGPLTALSPGSHLTRTTE